MASKKDDKDMAERAGDTGEHAAEAGRQAAERGAETSARLAERSMESATRAAERGMGQVADFGRHQTDQMRSLMGASARVYSDLGSRDNVDALMQSSVRLAKGVQDMSWEMMQYTQQSMQMGLKAANQMMTCRSIEDMLNVQRNWMRESVDTFLQESARLLEMSSSVATDAVNPLNDRLQ